MAKGVAYFKLLPRHSSGDGDGDEDGRLSTSASAVG